MSEKVLHKWVAEGGQQRRVVQIRHSNGATGHDVLHLMNDGGWFSLGEIPKSVASEILRLRGLLEEVVRTESGRLLAENERLLAEARKGTDGE